MQSRRFYGVPLVAVTAGSVRVELLTVCLISTISALLFLVTNALNPGSEVARKSDPTPVVVPDAVARSETPPSASPVETPARKAESEGGDLRFDVRRVVRTCMAIPQLRSVESQRPFASTEIPPSASDAFRECLTGIDRRSLLAQLCHELRGFGSSEQEDAIRLIAYLARPLLDGSSSLPEREQLFFMVMDTYRGLRGEVLSSLMSELVRSAYPVSPEVWRDKSGGDTLPKRVARALDRELSKESAPHLLGPLLEAAYLLDQVRPGYKSGMGGAPASPIEREFKKATHKAARRGLELGVRSLDGVETGNLRDSLGLLSVAIFAGALESDTAVPDGLKLLSALDDVDYSSVGRTQMRDLMAALVNQVDKALTPVVRLQSSQGRDVDFYVHQVRRKYSLPLKVIRVITADEDYTLTIGSEH